jgi:hypothetical protein
MDDCRMDNGGCVSHGWTMISVAATNSQMAGVLAGFVFSGIIILFTRRGPRDTQALGLLCAAFVVLAFDSFLFSFVTGGASDPHCARVWGEGLVACGMLAVGAVAVVNSICWLLAAHVDDIRAENASRHVAEPALINLDRLARWMVHGVIVGCALWLAMTTRDYLGIVYDGNVPSWLDWSVGTVPLTVGVTALALAAPRARRTRRQEVGSPTNHPRPVTLSVATFGTLTYGIAAPIFLGLLKSFPDHWWNDQALAVTVGTLATALFVPGLLLVSLVLAVPPFALRSTGHSKPAGVGRADDNADSQITPSAAENKADLTHSVTED